jgi:SAM-dependent methyltransferase/diadenosine tetraphosphate (Ap4A) HIT family hydrolase
VTEISSQKHAERDCELCSEITLAGTAVTMNLGEKPSGFSRLVRRSSVVDVLAGLGGIIPGYMLVIPRRHIRSMGELTESELIHVFDTAWNMVERVTKAFGGSAALVEHGSSGDTEAGNRACIIHAHIHIFPLDAGVEPNRFVAPGSSLINDLSMLKETARARKNYYYCAWNRDEGLFSVEPQITPQYARRIWAELQGKPDEWDWAACPYFGNAQFTATRLRRDELQSEELGAHLGDDELRETLAAYESGASWYAARTKAFPPGSTLPAEIAWLADHTDGFILDAGTGAGRDAVLFSEFGRPVIALDASMNLLLRIPANPNVYRVAGDVRCLPLPNASMGAVWCSAVLVHLGRDDVLRALKEIARVLVPDGLAEISVKEGSGHSSSMMTDNPVHRRHFFYYELDDLHQLAGLAGLRVVRTWTEDERDASATVQRWVKVLLHRTP